MVSTEDTSTSISRPYIPNKPRPAKDLLAEKNALVYMFIEDQELDDLFKTAVAAPQIGPTSFELGLNQILGFYTVDLEACSREMTQRLSALLVKTQTSRIARSIRQYYCRSTEGHSNLASTGTMSEEDKSTQLESHLRQFSGATGSKHLQGTVDQEGADDEDFDKIQDQNHMINAAKVFLTGGTPFLKLKTRLRHFVYPHIRHMENLVDTVFDHEPVNNLLKASFQLSPKLSKEFCTTLTKEFVSLVEALERESRTLNRPIYREITKLKNLSIYEVDKIIIASIECVQGTRERLSYEVRRSRFLSPRVTVSADQWRGIKLALASSSLADFVVCLGAELRRLQLTERIQRLEHEITDANGDGPHAKNRFNSILSELFNSNPKQLEIIQPTSQIWSDTIKHRLQERTGRCWDWWPLSDPHDKVADDNVWLAWICVSLTRKLWT